MSSNRVAWTYTDDEGNDWRVSALKFNTDQSKLGGAAAAATVPPRKGGSKMRRTTVSGNGVSRVVPVYAPDADIVTAGTSMNIQVNGSSVAVTSNGGVLKEGNGGRQTKQST